MLSASGCASIGDAIISTLPGRDAPEYPVDPIHDEAAKALEPEPGQGLIYLILETRRDDCGYLDVWLGDEGLGRVFEQDYLYAPAAPGVAQLKLQDVRADWRARRQFFYTTTVQIEIRADETTYIVVSPTRDRPCHYRDLEVAEYPTPTGRALLEQRELSRLNAHGFFERGMKLTGGSTVLTQRDYCGGRSIAAAQFGDLPNPYYCLYEEKELTREY